MTIKQLNDWHRSEKCKRHDYWQPEWCKLLTDKTANGLTKCLTRWAELNGYQAKRVNVMGIPQDNRRVVTDVLGFQKTIGSVEWRPSGSTKGAADVSMICHGRAIEVEVKIGRDRQSPAQKAYQQKVERAGGIYLIARTFEQVTGEIEKIVEGWQHSNPTLF